MSGDAFSSLTKLKKVWLNFNACINVNLEGETKIATLSGLIATRCGSPSESSNVNQENCDSFLSKIAKLETDLKTSTNETSKISTEKLQCENQVKQILDLQAKWEIRWDATFAFKTGELKDELKKKRVEIEEKNVKILLLERKIEKLSQIKGQNSSET